MLVLSGIEAFMSTRLSFDDFTLHQAAFEVRFDDAFLLWDRSGIVWKKVVALYTDLKPAHVEPSKVLFERRGDRDLQLGLETRRLGVAGMHPDSKLAEFSRVASQFSEITAETLEIETFSRVGLRVGFTKEFEDRVAAAEALLTTGIVNLPSEHVFGLDSPVVEPEFSLRKEDDKNGFSLRLKAEVTRVEFTPIFGLPSRVKPDTLVQNRVYLDVDYYMLAPVEATKMYFEDWIAQTFHIIKRDSRKFLGD
jgi:hypothetical protein